MGNSDNWTVVRYDDPQRALSHKRELERAGLTPTLVHREPPPTISGLPPPGAERQLELCVPPSQAARAVDILDTLIDDRPAEP